MKAKKPAIYTPQSIIGLVLIFTIFFGLLYSVGSYLHRSQKLQQEIDKIEQANIEAKAEIEAKKKKLAYLKTPQRLEKDAKIQMGKKLPGEKVYVFVEESILTPQGEAPKQSLTQSPQKERPYWERWLALFMEPRAEIKRTPSQDEIFESIQEDNTETEAKHFRE